MIDGSFTIDWKLQIDRGITYKVLQEKLTELNRLVHRYSNNGWRSTGSGSGSGSGENEESDLQWEIVSTEDNEYGDPIIRYQDINEILAVDGQNIYNYINTGVFYDKMIAEAITEGSIAMYIRLARERECSVCYASDGLVARYGCSHLMCNNCYNRWRTIREDHNCPICRTHNHNYEHSHSYNTVVSTS